VEEIGPGFWRVVANFGFMDEPDIPQALTLCAPHGLAIDPFTTSYFLSRETVVHRPACDGALARTPLRRDVTQRGPRSRLLPAAAQQCHRAGFARAVVTVRAQDYGCEMVTWLARFWLLS